MIRIPAERTKADEIHGVPIEGELTALIERRWKARVVGNYLAEHVFHRDGKPVVSFDKVWATACEATGLIGRIFHDFRRTAVRDMVNAGVPERVAMSISGHRTRGIFQRYHIVAPADQVNALRLTRAHRASALADERRIVTSLQAVRKWPMVKTYATLGLTGTLGASYSPFRGCGKFGGRLPRVRATIGSRPSTLKPTPPGSAGLAAGSPRLRLRFARQGGRL